ncbi:MAG: heparinase II/III family protein [Chitinophagaceae bacterium]
MTGRILPALFFILVYIQPVHSQRNLISNALQKNQPAQWLKPQLLHSSFPDRSQRNVWEKADRQSAVFLLANGEKYLGHTWTTLSATLFLDFAETGVRGRYQDAFFARREALSSLVMAECVEGKGRFVRDIANGIWAICEDSYWGLPAHLYLQKKGFGLPDVQEPTVDFSVAETASLLAWTSYLLKPALDSVSPLLCARISEEVERRVLAPNRERDDFWWMGFGERIPNNWNPWVVCNWIVASTLLDTNETRRNNDMMRMGRVLDNFLNHYPEDGGCDEGPGYWDRAGGALFDCLEFLYVASNGRIDLFQQPLIRRIGSYLHSAWIADDYFVNFADASAKIRYNPMLTYRFGVRTGNPTLRAFGARMARRQGLDKGRLRGTLYRQMEALWYVQDILKEDTVCYPVQQFNLPDLQVAGYRKGDFYFVAKGGHNDESHNHNDVGSFILYYQNTPLLIDAGVETYSARTFSDQRYQIWTMQSAYHNLPAINGVQQKEGRAFHASSFRVNESDGKGVSVTVDITGAYPSNALVGSWIRRYWLANSGEKFMITDQFQLTQRKDTTWLGFMCAVKPVIGNGYISFNIAGKTVRMQFPALQVTAVSEALTLTDEKLSSVWGNKLYRVRLLLKGAKIREQIQVTLAAE